MPKDRKYHHFPSLMKRRRAPEPPNDQLQGSTPNFSNIRIAVSATENDGTIRGDHDQPEGSHPGNLSSSSTLKDDAAEQRTRLRDRISELFRRSPSPNRRNQSSTPQPNYPVTETSPNGPRPLLSPLPTEVIPTALVGDDEASVGTQQEPSDIGPLAPAASSVTAESASRRSDGNRKDIIAGGTKAFLQTAATALKFVPIPNLDQIPNTLLTWIRIYENVSGNAEDLKQLCDVIQQAKDSVFEPLQTWIGKIPPELETLVEEFRVALQKQVKDIETVQNKHIVEKTVLASEITQQITNMKNCLNDAIHRFELRSLTLILLRTEHSSVQSELSRLRRAPAEHNLVKSKSECLPGTRASMQVSLIKHLTNAETRFVWLRGSPGTGKTAISMSVSSTLEEQGTLAASFFWDKTRTGSGLDSLELFPSTLSRQLASFNEDFRLSLVRRLRQPGLELVQDFPLGKQIKTLIIEPMRDLKDIYPPGKDRLVIVLDGLDECGNQETLKSLMTLVLALEELPPAFAVFVSCRPEPGVISAWSKARKKGHVIPCEDVDEIVKDEAFYTVRRMVVDGLQDLISESSWQPTEGELNDFSQACRGLPVVASIRVRDVGLQTRRGRTLQSAFRNLLDLSDMPADLSREYLRVLRQAYVLDSSEVPSDVAKKYRLVVGAIVVAREPMNVSFMSQLFGIGEDEIRATLEPIRAIINLPSENTEDVTFYHATAEEFIMGDPIGDEKDKVFFINDVKGYGYFLGLPLLKLFNSYCERNTFGIPADPPFGDERKWEAFMAKKMDYRRCFHYVIEYLLQHLDPSQLFSQEPNELQNEFNTFITRNYMLTFMQLQNEVGYPEPLSFPKELLQFHNHDLIQLLRELGPVAFNVGYKPWQLYRSELPFTPLSSFIHKQYGHLSDPVRMFSIFGKYFGGTIPLSEDSRRAQEVMHAKLSELPETANGRGGKGINYKAEFHEPDIRNGTVTSAALSLDGRYVALGFGNGIIEIADIDHQHTVCRFQPNNSASLPVWIEFVHGGHQVATEDIDGNVTLLSDDMTFVKLGTLPTGDYPAGTTTSDNGLFVVRVPRNLDNPWYDNMMLISVSGDPSIHCLASPPFSPSPQLNDKLATPHRRTLGFSPEAQYVGAFDGIHAVTWSTESFQYIAGYRVTNFDYWIINPTVPPTNSYFVPDPIFTRATLPLVEGDAAYAHHSDVDAGHGSDESWIKCPFYDLSPGNSEESVELRRLPTATRTPLIYSDTSRWPYVWLNGREALGLPWDYRRIDFGEAWCGYRTPIDSLGLYRPHSSKDGTRFLVQCELQAPIVIDISQIV